MNKDEDNLSREELRLFRLLVRLVEDFESRAYPIDDVSDPVTALRELTREHQLKQKDLVDVFSTQSVISEVLNGKRSISKAQAKRLGQRFGLPVEIFI